jgi:hypothetical protein
MSDESETYKVQIDGPGLSFARDIDGPTLSRLMRLLLGAANEAGLEDPDQSESPEPAAKARRLSLREFLLSIGVKRYPDKIVAIGYYLEEHEGKDGFSKEDIKSQFRAAGEPPPGNFPRDFSVAITAGWIAQDSANPRQFYVTMSGRDAVEAGFSGVPRPSRRKTPRRRRVPALTYHAS